MGQRVILKIAAISGGQIVYYIVLWCAWMWLGWNAHFLGLIATIVACILNPLLCACLAIRCFSVQEGKLRVMIVWLMLIVIAFLGAPLSNEIWLHASGYYHRAISDPSDGLGETLAWTQFFNIGGMAISGVIYVFVFGAFKIHERGKRRESAGRGC